MISSLLLLALADFLLNLPFGAWRVRQPPRSFRWFLAIHLPIPFMFLLRTALGLGPRYIIVSVVFAVAAQLLGGRWFAPKSGD